MLPATHIAIAPKNKTPLELTLTAVACLIPELCPFFCLPYELPQLNMLSLNLNK
jgi:hypothetical protein